MASFSERYHEFSKYNPLSIDRLNQVNWADEPRPFKSNPTDKSLDLSPWLQHLASLDPMSSEDEIGPDPQMPVLSPDFLASLFFHSAGITAAMQTEKGPFYFRANPSAGGIYPNESYFIPLEAFEVDGFLFQAGNVYHFQALNNKFYEISEGWEIPELKEIFQIPEGAKFLVLLSTIHKRGTWRYGERAYRRELLDCGHLASNFSLYLRAKSKHALYTCGFQDSEIVKKLMWGEEFPLLAMAVLDTPFESGTSEALSQGRSLPHMEAFTHIDQSQVLSAQQCQMEAQFQSWKLPEPPTLSEPMTSEARSESYPLSQHKIHNLKKIPLDMVKRRSTRSFHSGVERQGIFSKFSEMVDFALDKHPQAIADQMLQTWLLFKGDEEHSPGIYLLNQKQRIWEKQPAILNWALLREVCLGQDLAFDSTAAIFHTAHLAQATEYFGDRAYRYLSFDAGIYGQLFQIAACHMGFGTSGVGGYFDDQANELLNLPLNHGIMYLTLLGTPEEL